MKKKSNVPLVIILHGIFNLLRSLKACFKEEFRSPWKACDRFSEKITGRGSVTSSKIRSNTKGFCLNLSRFLYNLEASISWSTFQRLCQYTIFHTYYVFRAGKQVLRKRGCLESFSLKVCKACHDSKTYKNKLVILNAASLCQRISKIIIVDV